MEINEVFKKYPQNEPDFNSVYYLTLVDIKGNICYSITFLNEDGEFEPKCGKVVAFAEMQPSLILEVLQ